MESTLSQPEVLPAYAQIADLVARDIDAGRLLPGERLPPERRMAADHGVAVGTLRKALARLEARDLIDRRQGSGNYVSAKGARDPVYALFRLELLSGGGRPSARMLDIARLPKPGDLARIGPSTSGIRFRRLRLLDATPIALEEIWLDADRARDADFAGLSDSLYAFYRDALDLWITRAEDRIGTGPVPDWTVADFAPPPGATVGHIRRIAWDRHGKPAETSRTWFDTTRATYASRLR